MLTKIKQDNMPYKQPKNTPIHNKDGASALPALAAIPMLAGKIGGAIKAIVTGGKIVGTTGKVVGTGGKAIAKSGGKKLALTAKEKALSKSLKKAGRESVKQAKKSMSLGQRVKNVGMQAENIARKGADKISKITGQSFDESLDLVKGKAKDAAVGIGTAGIAKVKQATQKPETGSAEDFLPESSSYTNPMGPSAKVSQGTKTNQGIQRTNPPVFSSLSRSNLKRQDDSVGSRIVENLKELDANVNIGGIPVNIGNVISTGAGVAKGADALVKHRKKLKEIERRIVNKKQSAQQRKQEQAMSDIAKDIKIENLKG